MCMAYEKVSMVDRQTKIKIVKGHFTEKNSYGPKTCRMRLRHSSFQGNAR